VAVAAPWRAAIEESEARQSLLLARPSHGLAAPFAQLDVHVDGRNATVTALE
ncbi:MAG: hypothetical protein ACJAZO_000373, partial [Myxococcota bacterium]